MAEMVQLTTACAPPARPMKPGRVARHHDRAARPAAYHAGRDDGIAQPTRAENPTSWRSTIL